MRGTGGPDDFFETEFVNRFDRRSISFQTVHDEPEKRRVNQEINTCVVAIYKLERLTLSGIQLKI